MRVRPAPRCVEIANTGVRPATGVGSGRFGAIPVATCADHDQNHDRVTPCPAVRSHSSLRGARRLADSGPAELETSVEPGRTTLDHGRRAWKAPQPRTFSLALLGPARS